MSDEKDKFTSADDDYHLRHHLVQPGFSSDDDRIYDAAMATIRAQLASGKAWGKVKQELQVADLDLRRIILDDFLKMSIAQQHFEGGASLKEVAKTLRVPLTALQAAKKSMLKEVQETSLKAYHLASKTGKA